MKSIGVWGPSCALAVFSVIRTTVVAQEPAPTL
jgi:hypothetical protein